MSARDLIQEALHSLEANKGRSLLTILGIVIGIASVIAMTSLIGGIQNSLVNSLGLNAARMVQIYSSQELTESDIEKLQKLVPQIEQIGIVDSAYTEYKTGDKSSLRGVPIPRPSLNQARAWRSSAAAAPISCTATNRMRWGKPSRCPTAKCRL